MRLILCFFGIHNKHSWTVPTTRRGQDGFEYTVTYCKCCKKWLGSSEVRRIK